MKDQTKAFYDKRGKQWTNNKTNSFHLERQFRIFTSLLPRDAKVLDIGCAGGIHVPMFLGIGRHLKYRGVDISKTMIAIAQSRYPQLTFKVGDIKDINMRFKLDAFWASAVLMHVTEVNQDVMFQNIEKHMKPGAIGFISLPEDRDKQESEMEQRTFTLYSKRRFTSTVTKRGWKVIKKGSYDSGNSVTSKWNWFIVVLPK